MQCKTSGVRGLLVAALVILSTSEVRADLIPVGHKSVKHELVFVESEALNAHRLVAAPIRGFHGVEEIRAGQRFYFSTKYGTRFYLLPADVDPLPEYDRDLFSQWPSADPPRSEIKSVPLISPVTSAVTTLRLIDIRDGAPVIEEVSHKEIDSSEKEVSWKSNVVRPLLLVPTGFVLLLVTVFALRRARFRKV